MHFDTSTPQVISTLQILEIMSSVESKIGQYRRQNGNELDQAQILQKPIFIIIYVEVKTIIRY